MAKLKHEWIRDGLERRGYTQRDLAKAWQVSDGLVTRFLQGTEGQRLFLDRAWQLANMLGISVDELARGLGITGKVQPPSIEDLAASPPLGTIKIDIPAAGVIRLMLHKDLPAEVATHIIVELGKAG